MRPSPYSYFSFCKKNLTLLPSAGTSLLEAITNACLKKKKVSHLTLVAGSSLFELNPAKALLKPLCWSLKKPNANTKKKKTCELHDAILRH
jgi:hypothetical protein